jgi:hypothetical protein
VPAEVEAMGEAAPDELGHEREQRKRECRQEALVTARPLHAPMVLRPGGSRKA